MQYICCILIWGSSIKEVEEIDMKEVDGAVFTPRQASFRMVNFVLGGSLVNMNESGEYEQRQLQTCCLAA